MDGTKLAEVNKFGSSLNKKNDVNDVGNVDKNVVNGADNVCNNVVNRTKKNVVNDVNLNSEHLAISEDILQYIRKTSSISAATLAKNLGISPRQVQRYLKQLRESGRIERIGGTRGYWEVKE